MLAKIRNSFRVRDRVERENFEKDENSRTNGWNLIGEEHRLQSFQVPWCPRRRRRPRRSRMFSSFFSLFVSFVTVGDLQYELAYLTSKCFFILFLLMDYSYQFGLIVGFIYLFIFKLMNEADFVQKI